MSAPTAALVQLVHAPTALVDADDLAAVTAAGPWHFSICDNRYYASRQVRDGDEWRTERLHTFLTGWPLVDHINGDGLDNRRANLRPATPSQNSANGRRQRRSRSGYKGAYWHASSGTWSARITVNGRQISLGYHPTAEAAARVYDRAASEHFGDFARLNFPKELAS